AAEARDRMLKERLALVSLQPAGLAIGQAGDVLETLLDVALPDKAIEGEVRGVALDACARLLLLGHPSGLLLVEEREGVTTPIAVVDRERVAGEDPLEPRVAIELLLGRPTVARAEAAPAVLRGRRQRGLQIRVVLHRPVLAPHLGVDRVLGHIDQPDERLPCFLLALEDV